MNLGQKLSPGATGININASTITKHRLVGYGTPTSTNRQPINGLNVVGVGAIAGALQDDVPTGEACTYFAKEGDEVVLESDGTGTIAYGQRVCAGAGGSRAASGRIAALPGSPVAGTNYEIVGTSITPETVAAAPAGNKVRVRWCRYTYQG